MAGYLVVAHQTADSPELREHLAHLLQSDPSATFTLLVPATDPSHLLVWEAGAPAEIASNRAEQARLHLQSAGIKVGRIAVGAPAPIQAIEEELRSHPGVHDAVILCTLPPGMSHWLGLDAPREAEQRFEIPVTHLTAGQAYR